MTTNLINTKDIMPASQIVDFFNGNYMFYIENPYFTVKNTTPNNKNNFLKYNQITNGSQITEPKIYAKINGKYTTDFKIKLFSTNRSCRLFGPYVSNGETIKIKSMNKFMINLGKPNDEDIEMRIILLLNQQLCTALDFLMIAKFLDIEIPNNCDDAKFIKLVANKLDYKDEDKLSEFIDKLNAKKIAIYDKSDMADPTEIGLFDIMKDEIHSYIRKPENKELYKKNPINVFFKGNFKNVTSPLPAIKINRSIGINKQTNEEQMYENVTGKLGYILLIPGGKNGMFATKILKNKQLVALEYEEYMKYTENKSKKDCNFIVSLNYDIRTFQSGPVVGTKLDVSQCIIKESKMTDEPILFDLDENEDEDDIITTF